MRNRRVLAAVVLASSVVLAACGTGDDSQAAVNGRVTTTTSRRVTTTVAAARGAIVHVQDDRFDPTEVEIRAGQAVVWHWDGTNPHNVDGPGFKSKIQTSGSFTKTFPRPGDFDYRCDVHPTMEARVVVS